MTIHWKAVEQYFTVMLFVLVILENLSGFELALSGVKRLIVFNSTVEHVIGSLRCKVLCNWLLSK